MFLAMVCNKARHMYMSVLQNEVKLLQELLPKYYAHVERYPHTLLIKFYGLHRVVPLNGSKVGCPHSRLNRHMTDQGVFFYSLTYIL